MKRKESSSKLLIWMLVMIVLHGMTSTSVYAHEEPRNILILNSYHKGLSWTDEQTEGICRIIRKHNERHELFVEYMDWKNYPTEKNLVYIYNHLKYKYSEKRIDVLLVTDNAALDFAIKHRKELFSDAPIVFSGINLQDKDIEKLPARITGVVEVPDPENTIRAALHIIPKLREIYVVFDNSESGLSIGAEAMEAIKRINPKIKAHAMNQKSEEEIIEAVSQAADQSAVLITTYYKDAFGHVVGFEDFTREISQSSKVPVFHLYDFGIENGAIGGSVLSGKIQGEHAGEMVTRILEGESISEIPIETEKNAKYIFDYIQLKRFQLPINQVPKGSEIVNRPFSFYETYKNLVLTAALIFTLLEGFIFVLVFYLGKLSKMKRELQRNHEELTESDDRLKQQYAELVTVQQNLISSENRYSLLFEKMLNGFYVFEPVLNEEGKLTDLRFVDVNPGFGEQTGMRMEMEDMKGRTWTEALGYPNQNLAVYHEMLRSGEAKCFETYYPNTDSYYLVNAFKITERQIGVVFDNITSYKKAIKVITMINEELEQRVIERTDELQNVVSELEAFTYTVSHDLKSPLRAVDGYSRIVMEDYGIILGEEGRKMISNIRHICKDMIEMINMLLKYSTTSQMDVNKEQVDTEEIFTSIFDELKSANPDRELQFILETGMPQVWADRVMLRQAVYNFLNNAVKFTKYREKAMITAGCTITSNEYVFYIKDNGAGFEMEYSKKLFGIFQRLHTNDEFEGSGIGLVTVKKIIQKHGGRVWIEGKVDAGAAAYFTLPLTDEAAQ